MKHNFFYMIGNGALLTFFRWQQMEPRPTLTGNDLLNAGDMRSIFPL
jgi:hypothetical protein